MKKVLTVGTIFLVGFLIGAITVNLFSIPARRAYRELLQMSYLTKQHSEATTALKEGRHIDALVHLRNQLDAGPETGAYVFDTALSNNIDRSFWFLFFPLWRELGTPLTNWTKRRV